MGAFATFIGKVWAWVSTPANLAVLLALGAGIGFAWNKYSPSPPTAQSAPVATQTATASDGATAANGSGSSTVAIGAQPPGAKPNPAPATVSAPAVNQTASATTGGVAANGAGSALVHVPQPREIQK